HEGAMNLRVANLQWDAALWRHELKEYDRAVALLQSAGAAYKYVLGEKSADGIDVLLRLAQVATDSGDKAAASAAYREALPLIRAVRGVDHAQYYRTAAWLGIELRKLKDYTVAEGYYLAALPLYERHIGASDPETANVLRGLAVCQFDAKRWESAAASFSR